MATSEISSILVARNDRLGDWVLTLPLLEELEAALPGVRLGAMARPAMAPLLERRRSLKTFIASGGKGWRGFRKAAAAVRDGDFDAAVVVHPDFVDTLVVWFAGVGVRVGNGYRGYSFLYNRRVKFHRSPSTRHEVEYNLKYLEGLGLAVPAEAPPPRLEVTAEDRAAARALLAARGVGGEDYVVVHPGSGGSSLNWSPRRYRVLAAELGKALAGGVVVTGTAEEAELASYVAGEGPGRVAVAGDTPFGTLLGLLGGARLFVSANTGPMHVAAAVGTPTVSLFSPLRSGSPTRWGPRGNASAVVVPPGLACAKCTGERCKHFNCMEAITVEEVLAAARRVVAGA